VGTLDPPPVTVTIDDLRTIGDQNVNVRSLGLLTSIADIGNVVVAEKNGTPVLVRDVATIREGFQPRLGKIGRNGQKDIVEAIVLLQKDEKSLPALDALKKKIAELNRGTLLPAGMHISTIYDRTRLIDLTTHTVKHVILTGLFLVTLILLVMLGDLRTTLIAAATIPFAVLFAFSMMALTGHSANLISIGAIDFGILVDASIIVLESISTCVTSGNVDRSARSWSARVAARSNEMSCGRVARIHRFPSSSGGINSPPIANTKSRTAASIPTAAMLHTSLGIASVRSKATA